MLTSAQTIKLEANSVATLRAFNKALTERVRVLRQEAVQAQAAHAKAVRDWRVALARWLRTAAVAKAKELTGTKTNKSYRDEELGFDTSAFFKGAPKWPGEYTPDCRLAKAEALLKGLALCDAQKNIEITPAIVDIFLTDAEQKALRACRC
jgi:hypothetical protein